MATPESDSFVRSFARGLSVIEVMGRGSQAHTVASVAMATGLPRSVAKRILMTLTELGYSIFDGKHFRLTPKVLSLGMTYLSSLPFWGLAQNALETLCAEVKESVALTVFDGQAAMYLLRIPSRDIMSLQLGVGSRVPAYATSPGRVLLAQQAPEALDRYFAATELRAWTRKTLTDPLALRQELGRVEAQGYSWVDAEFDAGVCGLSVPVRDASGEAVAAISANLLSGSLTQVRAARQFLKPLRAASEHLRAMAPQFLSTASHTSQLAGR